MKFPRILKPELVQPNDKIRVTFKSNDGVTFIHEGTVDRIHVNGNVHHVLTYEGGRLFSWEIGGRANPIKIELMYRPPFIQEELPGMSIRETYSDVIERIQ